MVSNKASSSITGTGEERKRRKKEGRALEQFWHFGIGFTKRGERSFIREEKRKKEEKASSHKGQGQGKKIKGG